MTTATCIYCGTLKFGAFVPCQECDRIPTERNEVIRSLALTDHHFTHAELGDFGIQIRNGEQPIIDAELQSKLASEVDDDMIDTLVKMSDPTIREYYRKRERNIILTIMGIILAATGWMIYRFAVVKQQNALESRSRAF